MLNLQWEQDAAIKPLRAYNSIELFAGAGGLAIGLEQAGFHAVALNEIDKAACQTLRLNRPHWKVLEGDIQGMDFSEYQSIDFVLLTLIKLKNIH
jgi:DNA (cytosine-5)-methyltransferase 1